MYYLTYGDKNRKSVVLVQVDGHIPGEGGVLESFEGALGVVPMRMLL